MADAADESTEGEAAPDADASSDADESIDSFLRAAARVPGDSGTGAVGVRVGMLALREGLIVAKRYRLDRKLGEGGMGVDVEPARIHPNVERRPWSAPRVLGR